MQKPDGPTKTLVIENVPSEVVAVFDDLVSEFRFHERGGALDQSEGEKECLIAMVKNFCEHYEPLEKDFYEGTIIGYHDHQRQLRQWEEEGGVPPLHPEI